MTKNSIKYIIIIYFLAFLGLIIGSFYDLEINKSLYSNGSFFPTFFKITGEMPMIILIMISSLSLYQSQKYNVFTKIILFLLFIIFPTGSALSILSYFEMKNIFIFILIVVFYLTIVLFLNTKIPSLYKQKLNKYFLFIIISIISTFILFNIMKEIWGRMRFIAMFENKDFSPFTNWWIINGKAISDSFKSFPSGHTASAATTLVLLFLPNILKYKNLKYEKYYYIIPILWTFLVAISRIYDGAHFLTDVSMGIILAMTVIIVVYKGLYKKYNVLR